MERSDDTFRTVARLAPAELAAFDAVMRYGGFRAAARATGASASGLSHAVASLERRLATQLLLRNTRHVSLTDAGRRFLEALRPALDQLSSAVAELEGGGDKEPAGLVRINASAIAVEQIMETLLTPFMRSAPGVRVDIRAEDELVDIAEHGFDCGIRLLELVPDDYVAVPIGPDTQQHIVVGSPDYLDSAPPLTSPSDLVKHRCIQLRLARRSLYRWEFAKDGESLSVRTDGSLTVDSSRLALAAALGGLGLAYVTRISAEDALAAGRLVQCLEGWTPPYPGLALYYARHRHMSSAMRALVAFLRDKRSSSPSH